MDFDRFFEQWNQNSLVESRRVLLEKAWLDCCRTWVHGGPAPSGQSNHLVRAITSFAPPHGALADACLECARLALDPQWTSRTVSTQALSDVVDRLAAEGLCHLSVGSLRDLTHEF